MKRIKLHDRKLPSYSLAEELVNAISHGVGGLFGILVCFLCIGKTWGNSFAFAGSVLYGLSMILLYTMSTLYHSLIPGISKKVFQIIDHCTIYVLIAGTYTPILLEVFVPAVPLVGWGLLVLQWGVSALAITLNAIDLKKYRIFSYSAYIILGWAILPFWSLGVSLMGMQGMGYLLLGGISYTIGAVLYGIGSKRPWFHSVFHIFVVLGSILQFVAIYDYVL